jgi:hypothetical protein
VHDKTARELKEMVVGVIVFTEVVNYMPDGGTDTVAARKIQCGKFDDC